MTENEFLEIVVALCKRPKMYTPSGTFFEVVSFLDGFGIAAHVRPEKDPPHSTFPPFFDWLDNNLDHPPDIRNWDDFLRTFGPDANATEHLQRLYGEYVSEGGRGSIHGSS